MFKLILKFQTHVPKSESTQPKTSSGRAESTAVAPTDRDNDPYYQGSHATSGNIDSGNIYADLDVKQQKDVGEPTVAGASAVDPQFDQPGGLPGIYPYHVSTRREG